MQNMTFELDEELLGKITKLIQLDIDATLAYSQAIEGIEEEHSDVRAQLEAFKADHERHVRDLSGVLMDQGQEPPEHKRDAKGFLIEGMTAIRAKMGTKQSLKAMRQNEMLTNKKYEDALELVGLPDPVLDIVRRGREDERRHLDYIVQTLDAFDRGEEVAPAT